MRSVTSLRKSLTIALLAALSLIPAGSYAHFGMVIPSHDIVEKQEDASLFVNIMFAHPFEGQSMNMEKPVRAGVLSNGKKIRKKVGKERSKLISNSTDLGLPQFILKFVEPIISNI